MKRITSEKMAKIRVITNIGRTREEIGLIVAAEPKTRVKLTRLLPIASPIAREYSFFLKAAMAVESSGREVPIATKVEPIKLLEKPAVSAREIEN